MVVQQHDQMEEMSQGNVQKQNYSYLILIIRNTVTVTDLLFTAQSLTERLKCSSAIDIIVNQSQFGTCIAS